MVEPSPITATSVNKKCLYTCVLSTKPFFQLNLVNLCGFFPKENLVHLPQTHFISCNDRWYESIMCLSMHCFENKTIRMSGKMFSLYPFLFSYCICIFLIQEYSNHYQFKLWPWPFWSLNNLNLSADFADKFWWYWLT